MSDWQLIETAPKDGSAVLVFDPAKDDPIYVCRFASYTMNDGKGGRRIYMQCWQEAGGEEHEEFRPTHWQPLPEPP